MFYYGVLTDANGQKLAFAARGASTALAKSKTPWHGIGLPEAMPAATETQVLRVRAMDQDALGRSHARSRGPRNGGNASLRHLDAEDAGGAQ